MSRSDLLAGVKPNGRVAVQSDFRNATLRLSEKSALEPYRDGTLIFSEQEQQLSRLDGASALLVPLLQRGTSFLDLVLELRSREVAAEAAETWVTSLLHQLATLSLLEVDGDDHISGAHRQSVQLGPAGFELFYASDELRDIIAPLFNHLASDAVAVVVDGIFHISDFGAGLVQIREEGSATALAPLDMTGVRLKSILLERMFQREPVAALHAALVAEGDGGTLLLGSPGAGKSTLALALLGAGYEYGSDDVTLVNPDGTVTGLALAPGVKEGSWELAKKLGIELLPAQMRPDGQQVRFARIAEERIVRSCRVSKIVSLHRTEGAKAEFRPMTSHEAIAELLRESRSTSGNCDVQTMAALAELVRGSTAYRLYYAEAAEAADLIAAYRP